eukprot:CAMPEP_0184863086 /NCGR_PEP_ID=MMETSP0580-20130426/9070_1 /TAXON_ID=1118495 /ORGANISM="Dactyliosolen fragilissimus" /LENGTH=344 /DNA_ID=CAMNT_0027361183 /DNA_START=34 /DNA_END=1068 /DNA_ORIENTATION=-
MVAMRRYYVTLSSIATPAAAAFLPSRQGDLNQQKLFGGLSSKVSTPFLSATVGVTSRIRGGTESIRGNLNQPLRMIGSILDLLGGGGKGELIDPEKALPGRQQKMPNISGLKHYVLGNDLEEVPEGYKVAIFANGCFWGSEKGIWRLPFGIHSTAVGYCAGFTPNPSYEEACSGLTGHTEGVRVVYDPSKISFVDILRWFWEAHDPCSGMGQGNDRGTQYRSGFYYFDDDQKRLIEASKTAYEQQLGRTITTEIADASDYEKYGGIWFFAEPYHQQYLSKPGSRPYCSAQPQGVSLADFNTWAPDNLKEEYSPKLPESFWKKHGPKRGCSVVQEPNEPISVDSY